jgi:hypothetical protein
MARGLFMKKSGDQACVLKNGFGYLSGLPNSPSSHAEIADAQVFKNRQEAIEAWQSTRGSDNPAVRAPQIINVQDL